MFDLLDKKKNDMFYLIRLYVPYNCVYRLWRFSKCEHNLKSSWTCTTCLILIIINILMKISNNILRHYCYFNNSFPSDNIWHYYTFLFKLCYFICIYSEKSALKANLFARFIVTSGKVIVNHIMIVYKGKCIDHQHRKHHFVQKGRWKEGVKREGEGKKGENKRCTTMLKFLAIICNNMWHLIHNLDHMECKDPLLRFLLFCLGTWILRTNTVKYLLSTHLLTFVVMYGSDSWCYCFYYDSC